MKLSHINIPISPNSEPAARHFYATLLGLPEIPKPQPLRSHGGLWFDAGGLDLHLSVDDAPRTPDSRRHFGLELPSLDALLALKAKLAAHHVPLDEGRPAPWQRFFALDPFGNRIEFHEPNALRA